MKHHVLILAVASASLVLASCGGQKTSATHSVSGIDAAKFADTRDGKPTALYTLRSSSGIEADITNYGGRIVSLMVPDRDGNMLDVVLGFDSIAAYYPENNKTDFGAAIGRYGNRIDHGRLVIDGDSIQLPVNNFGHSLHGGPNGWQYQVYSAEQPNDSTLVLTMDSPDGDNGFPGNIHAVVTYTLLPGNKLDIAYSATTDRPTVINLTNHSYFNLGGDASRTILDHDLEINSSGFTPIDSTYMTTGEILPVENTPMDFRSAKAIGCEIDNFEYEQLKNGNGYDHNWVLDTKGDINTIAATLSAPSTGIGMNIYTTEPGIQVYSGNFLDGTVTGKGGVVYNQRTGIAMETQHYPDSPNKPQWPSTLVRPGEIYSSHTVLEFYNF
ncbi:MAG: galactose mutarotase [Duncaniella sp.]|nr:galactose mutarotase [Duncaniella sp.]